MENIQPLHCPAKVHNHPTAHNATSPGSSVEDLPLLEQPTRSDCSAAQFSTGSSSDFNVRPLTRQEGRLSTVDDGAEPPERSRHGTWDVVDPPTPLTPREDWVPAEDVYSGSVLEVINDNQASEVTDNNQAAEENSRHVAFEDPVAEEANEGSTKPFPSASSTIFNSTVPRYGGISEIRNVKAPDEEIYRLRQIEDPRGPDQEVFDLPKTTRARLYMYYISRVRKLKVLCDQGKDMTDLPVQTEDDYELLRSLTRTNWGSRWWTIMIEDLICPECVLLLKARRSDLKSITRTAFLRIKSRIRGVCLCRDNNHDFECYHTRTDMNKVTRFFHTLGGKDTLRMVNIEFDTNPRFPVDIDVLSSAVYNAGRYFKDAQRFSIKFHFGPEPIERECVEGIVCSLAKLEAVLPWPNQLHVAGFEDHHECNMAWVKKSRARKWWMR